MISGIRCAPAGVALAPWLLHQAARALGRDDFAEALRTAQAEFDRVLGDRENQVDQQRSPEFKFTAAGPGLVPSVGQQRSAGGQLSS